MKSSHHLLCTLACVVLFSPAMAQALGNAIRIYPDSISMTSAVLRAWVNPQGGSGEVKLLWHPAGGTMTEVSAGIFSGTERVEIRKRVTNLSPNTLYGFEAIWVPAPMYGEEVLFRTLPDTGCISIINRIAMFDAVYGPELTFGVRCDATYCTDLNLGEIAIPPIPPQGVPDIRLVDPHGFNPQCMDQGVYLDLRPYADAAQVDTYKVRIDPGYLGYPVPVSWSNMSRYYSGPVRLRSPLNGGIVDVDMKATDRIVIDDQTTFLYIIASGPLNPSVPLSAGETVALPLTYVVFQNYPNPFNPSTTIKYDLPKDSRVSLQIFDILGREVATLVNGEQTAGLKSVEWNASSFASGVYYYRIQAGEYTATRKLLLLK
jgi:hypothetical protein